MASVIKLYNETIKIITQFKKSMKNDEKNIKIMTRQLDDMKKTCAEDQNSI